MKVYLTFKSVDYEGTDHLTTHATREGAQKAIAKLARGWNRENKQWADELFVKEDDGDSWTRYTECYYVREETLRP